MAEITIKIAGLTIEEMVQIEIALMNRVDACVKHADVVEDHRRQFNESADLCLSALKKVRVGYRRG